MTRATHKIGWLHLATVTAAVVAVMLIATGASLWHIDARVQRQPVPSAISRISQFCRDCPLNL